MPYTKAIPWSINSSIYLFLVTPTLIKIEPSLFFLKLISVFSNKALWSEASVSMWIVFARLKSNLQTGELMILSSLSWIIPSCSLKHYQVHDFLVKPKFIAPISHKKLLKSRKEKISLNLSPNFSDH